MSTTGHPEEQLAVVTGGVETFAVEMHLRHLREMGHEFVFFAFAVYQPDGAVGHAVGGKVLVVTAGKCGDLT